MSRKLQRDSLRSELASLDGLLKRIPTSSAAMRKAYELRRQKLVAQLAAQDKELDTTAHATIFLGGRRVIGSEAIDAGFAAETLQAFQSLVFAQALQREGMQLGARGPLVARDDLRLNITGTVRGSFGFTLEENAPLGQPLFSSVLKEALEKTTSIIWDFAAVEEERYAAALDRIDPRMLVGARTLFKALNDADATIRIVEGERDAALDSVAVARANERAQRIEIDEQDIELDGVLIGVTPVSGGFDFRPDGSGFPIRGKTGPRLGREFLERIEQEGVSIGGGRRWRASLRRKIIRRPPGEPRESYILTDISPIPQD